jgi:hypothetical protein
MQLRKNLFLFTKDVQFLYSCNVCITLNTSTCFEQYYAHLQEVKIVFLQHLVSSLSLSDRIVHRLRAESNYAVEKYINYLQT